MQTSFPTTESTALSALWRMGLYSALLCSYALFAATVFAADAASVKAEPHSVTISVNSDGNANAVISETSDHDKDDHDEMDHNENEHHEDHHDMVQVFGDSTLQAGQQANNLVSVFGSSTNEGDVSQNVVSVLGNTRVTGTTGQNAVAVFGNNYINNKVGQNVVAVLGDVELGPQADIGQNVVAVGGIVKRDRAAIVHGGVQSVGAHLGAWFQNCLFKGRLLAFDSGVMWAWWIAFIALFVYLLTALIFPRAVNQCVTVMEENPGHSALTALLATIGMPIIIVLLCITVIGIIAIPFIGLLLMIAGFFGKVIMLAWIGRRLIKVDSTSAAMSHPVVAVLIGGIILMLVYVIPFVGFIVYKLVGFMGLGVALYALLQEVKSRRGDKNDGGSGSANNPADLADVTPAAASASSQADLGSTEPSTNATDSTPTSAIELTSLPRAGFWVRMIALLIDLILVGAIVNFAFHDPERWGIDSDHMIAVLLVIYGIVMWKLKGATVGDIIFKLQVIRADGREIDWPTAIVRGLSCFLSFIVIFLGFFWIAFDEHKQAWHDKIAGTLVVRTPKPISLL